MNDIKKLERRINGIKNRIGLVGGMLEIKEYDESSEAVSAHISPQGWKVQINLRKGFNPLHTTRQRAYARLKKIDDGLETLVKDISYHEFAHWELPFNSGNGCPYDIYNHDKILEAVKNTLPKDKKQHAPYVVNAFEDLMINPRCKEFNGDFAGQVLFWDWQGIKCKEEGLPYFTPFYEAFVKLNMHLFGDDYDKSLLKKHYSNNPDIEKGINAVVKDLRLPENIIDNNGTSMLFVKRNWPRMASSFAKNLAHLLEISPKEKLSAFQGNGDGEGKESNAESEGSAGNGIEEKIGSREGKEEISFGRYSGNENQSTNLTSYEQLDSLYRKLGRAIPVKIEAMTRSQGVSLGPLNYRAFDAEKDDPNKIKFTKMFLTDDGLEFGHEKQPLTTQARYKMQRKSFPDFKMVVLDNSGSMKEGINGGGNGNTNFIPWGDQSKYHYALLGFYGIENFLQSQGIAQYINHGVSLFSNTTRYKETGFLELEQLRKLALSPEFGNTRLDAETLVRSLDGRESFVLSLSDGAIENWSSQKAKVKDLAKNNYFAHIQIGGETEYTRDLISWDVPVFYVSSGNDLSKLMVDVAKKTYVRFTKK